MTTRVTISLTLILFIILSVTGRVLPAEPDPDRYQYDQTRLLVDYVRRAADLFSREGEKAFPEFARKDGPWFHQDRYLFINDLEGICVFQPVDRELVGKNLLNFRDLDDKPVIRYIIDTVTSGNSSDGWVHYLWAEPGEIFPLWKSSYVTRVKTPSGKDYVIGSGIYNMRIEQQFIVDTVNAAVELIKKNGTDAFREMEDKSSRFIYQDVYIFVLTMTGKAVVDPAFPSDIASQANLEGRNLLDFRDAVGKYPIREMIEKLKTDDSGWIMYMWPRTGESKPSKKLAYIKKVRHRDQTLIVGSDLFLATPIWMR